MNIFILNLPVFVFVQLVLLFVYYLIFSICRFIHVHSFMDFFLFIFSLETSGYFS